MIRVVVAGIGETVERPDIIEQGSDPLDLMAVAARAACADAGVAAGDVDAIDIIQQVTWRYENTARSLCERLGLEAGLARYHPGGGESPIRLIHDAALAIARGERKVSLVMGGEARNTASKARKSGIALPWPPRAAAMEQPWTGTLNDMAFAHGVAQPTFVYPFYENAWVAAHGQTPAEGMRESAMLWARYARVAETNPYAWIRSGPTEDEIAEPSQRNPLIAYPYTRFMVANPTVNQGAAILLMSEEAAYASGIPADRLIYILGGAAAKEPDDYLLRDRYDRSPAQDAVLDAARGLADRGLDAVELYSCFPCVPKMAAATLDLPPDATPTVTGGLTFFGGPYNSYMAHATAAMVRTLRQDGGTGLLYGQGDFVTKHHALVLSSRPPAGELDQNVRVDAAADAARGPVPIVLADWTGVATLETFTVLYGPNASINHAVVILRTKIGARTMARVPASEAGTIAVLTDADSSPVGRSGVVTCAADGLLEWTVA